MSGWGAAAAAAHGARLARSQAAGPSTSLLALSRARKPSRRDRFFFSAHHEE